MNIKLRDFGFISVGFVIFIIFNGIYFRWSEYIKQRSVSEWLNENAESLKFDSINGKARLINNTVSPGTLRIVCVEGESDEIDVIKNISFKVIKLNCPFPIIRVD